MTNSWINQFSMEQIKEVLNNIDKLCLDCPLSVRNENENACEGCAIRKLADKCMDKMEEFKNA